MFRLFKILDGREYGAHVLLSILVLTTVISQCKLVKWYPGLIRQTNERLVACPRKINLLSENVKFLICNTKVKLCLGHSKFVSHDFALAAQEGACCLFLKGGS